LKDLVQKYPETENLLEIAGVGPVTKFPADGYACQIAAELKGFEPERFIAPKLIKRLDPFVGEWPKRDGEKRKTVVLQESSCEQSETLKQPQKVGADGWRVMECGPIHKEEVDPGLGHWEFPSKN